MIKANIFSFNTDNARQRVNVSPETMAVIYSDMEHFCQQPIQLSTFMNLIFYNHFLESRANLNLRFQEQREKYEKKLRIKDPQVIETLLNDYRKEIEKEIESLEKGTSVSILISRRNLDILQGIDEYSENFKCYKKRSVLFNAFYSNYASLSDRRRFEICQRNLIALLDEAIAGNKAIRIKEGNRDSVFFPIRTSLNSNYPQSYMIDTVSSYTYIIGFPGKSSVKLERKRIDELSSIIRCDVSFSPSPKQRQKIFEFQEKEASIFSTEEVIQVDVRLTDAGIKKLQRIKWLRPNFNIDISDGHLFHFMCSHENAIYYFQRFGADAIVVSPLDVKNELTQIYKEAYEAYAADQR